MQRNAMAWNGMECNWCIKYSAAMHYRYIASAWNTRFMVGKRNIVIRFESSELKKWAVYKHEQMYAACTLHIYTEISSCAKSTKSLNRAHKQRNGCKEVIGKSEKLKYVGSGECAFDFRNLIWCEHFHFFVFCRRRRRQRRFRCRCSFLFSCYKFHQHVCILLKSNKDMFAPFACTHKCASIKCNVLNSGGGKLDEKNRK